MVNEGSVEAFYGGGAKVSVSSAGIQPTANPSVDEAFNVGNQVGLDVAEQEIMNRNPSVEVNYGAEGEGEGEEDGFYCQGVRCYGLDILHPDNEMCEECLNMGFFNCRDCCSEEMKHNAEGEDMTLKDSAKLGFGVGAGLLGFNVALLGIATIGGFLLNRD